MRKLSLDQRRSLAEFCGNFAVAWLTAGVIPSFILGKITLEVLKPMVTSIFTAGGLLTVMLSLLKSKGGKK